MAPEEKLTADQDAIRQDLEFMTRRWGELDVPAIMELRAFSEGKAAQSARFGLNLMADAVRWAASMNERGYNIYVVRNPIRHDIQGSASDKDIIAAFFMWADCDDPSAAGNVRRFDGPKWTAAVTTGRTPSVRVHIYWELEDACRNLEAWRQMQMKIAAHFQSDPAVINPSRIMRVGGTVAYPDTKKQAKGYINERTTIRTEYEEEREPVSFEQMFRVFANTPTSPSEGATAALDFDTGPQPLDRERARIQALSGQEWHNAVIRLVGSYVSRGLSDDEIHSLTDALTLNGYTVEQTRREVQTAIDGARRKGWAPDQDEAPAEKVIVPGEAPFKTWKPIDPLAHPRRNFIYGKHYIRKFASVTVAPGGLGKSTLVLAECIAIATGRDFLGVVPKQREKVVYFNAEDPLEEIERRVLAMCQHHGITQDELVGWLFLASGRDTELILSAGEDGDIVEAAFELIEKFNAEIGAGVYAFDPLANMTESPETNDVFRRLGKRLSRMADSLNCSIELVHHTRKLNGKEAEVEDSRGGGALIGAVRAGRVLNPMTPEDAAKAGIDTHIDHFRIEAAGKNNLARAAERASWLRRVDVELPNGEHVAAVETWEWPDAFDGVTPDDARKVQLAIGAMEDEPPRANPQSGAWVGHIVARTLGLDSEDKADRSRINAMVKAWIKSGVLEAVEVRDTRAGRDVKAILPGSNVPNSEAS